MVAANFAPSVTLERAYEGDFVNSPKDPGGATKYGITLYALGQHRGQACTVADVQALGWGEAEAIYHSTYWPAVRADEIPAGVDLALFDSAVNCGRGTAVRFLQAGLGVSCDGAFGPATLAKLRCAPDLPALLQRIRAARATYYRGLRLFATFGAGWLNRDASVTNVAIAWQAKA